MNAKLPSAESISAQPPDQPLKLSQVLAEEFRKLHQEFEFRQPDGSPESSAETQEEKEDRRRREIYEAIHTLERKRWALCLSGGGIRSATFCLGVLQGLARSKFLGRFDYLSTVSGGGYIGSWLTAWIHREGVPVVFNALAKNQTSKLPAEHEQISYLRSHSNYLSPRIGLFSVDTWTLVSIYLRNLFLNWLVFLPLLLAVLLIPRIYASLVARNFASPGLLKRFDLGLTEQLQSYLSVADPVLVQAYLSLFAGLVLSAIALAYIGAHRPSLRREGDLSGIAPETPATSDTDNQHNFLRWSMLPLTLAILLLTLGRAWYLLTDHSLNLAQFTLGGAGLYTLSWVLTSSVVIVCFFGRHGFARYWNAAATRWLELAVFAATGALTGALLWLLSIPEKINILFPAESPELYACFDGPQLLLVVFFMGVVSVGLAGRSITDEDREWWARAGAWMLIVAALWAALNSLVLYGPMWPEHILRNKETNALLPEAITKGLLLPFGIVSGFITILFGVSAKTPANARQAEKAGWITTLMDYAVKLASPVFVLTLIVGLSFFTDLLILLIKRVPRWYDLKVGVLEWSGEALPALDHHDVIVNTSSLFLAVLCLLLLAISFTTAWFININEFSLHSMYRNRLIRAYLGASRKGKTADYARKPNLFTGFDPADDLSMSELWPNAATPIPGKESQHQDAGKPLHIINMTWNLVQGKNLAWQQRKATTFTVSPLHCGNYLYGYRPSQVYGGRPPQPISLGTAFTISGAAASPNMGYYSSSAVTFLMTLFNARLGWWLGNPVKALYQRSGPRWALKPMIDEAFGKTDEDKNYIYLSDGGHFENLGLYEMVLRRCQTIFVIDASSDPDRKFENLGNAIRRIRVDLGVPIEIMDIVNYPEKQDTPKAYCAVGDIRYKQVDGVEGVTDGVLIYIKPMLTGQEPTDIFNYAKANIKFPHESTSDQFFSEQQFESYRELGSYTIEQIFNAALPTEENLRNLRSYLEKYLKGGLK